MELGRNSAGLAVRFRSNSHPDCRQMGGTAQQEYESHDFYRALKGLICIACKTGSGCLPEAGVRKGKVEWGDHCWRICCPKSVNILLFLSFIRRVLLGPSASTRCPNQRAGNGTAGTRSRLSLRNKRAAGGCASRPGMAHTTSWSVGSIGNVSIWDLAAMLYWFGDCPCDGGVDASIFVLGFCFRNASGSR